MTMYLFIAHAGIEPKHFSAFDKAERHVFAGMRAWASGFDKNPEYKHAAERKMCIKSYVLDADRQSPVVTDYTGTVKVARGKIKLTIERRYTYGDPVTITETLTPNIPEYRGMVFMV